MGEDGQGLRKIRNLGIRSENEIIEKIKEIKEIYAETHPAGSEPMKRTIIKPAKKDLGHGNRSVSLVKLFIAKVICLRNINLVSILSDMPQN